MKNFKFEFEQSFNQSKNLLQPVWLLNNLDDDMWYLASHLDGEYDSTRVINWKFNRVEYLGISTGRDIYWRNVGKCLTYYLMESGKTSCTKTSTLSVYAREVRAMCQWLCFERRCLNVNSIREHDIDAYEKYIGTLNVKVNTVILKLMMVKMLWKLRVELGEGLSFDPYISISALKKKARILGDRNGHTKTIKPNELFLMIDFALKNMSDAPLWINYMNTYLEDKKKYRKNVSVHFKKKTGISSSRLFDKLRILYGSALVIMLSLLAERKHELSATKYNDVQKLLFTEEDELIGLLHKTAKTISGKNTERPVIHEVKFALKIIIDLTDSSRELYSGELLLLRLPIHHCASRNPQLELKTQTLYLILNKFSEASGYKKKLRPHMFRRAFSMIWAWRYEVGDLHLLSKMLYHNNEIFTKFYTEDEDVWEFLPEAQKELAYDVMEKSLLGKNKLQGGFGKTLERYGRWLMSSVTVLSADRIKHLVENMFSRQEYRIISHSDGYCVMTSSRAKRARCSTDGIKPNYSNRDESYCFSCPNFAVDKSREKVWASRLRAHKKVFESTDIPMLKLAAQKGIERSEVVLKWINEPGSYDEVGGEYV